MIPLLASAAVDIPYPYAFWHSRPVIAEQVVNDAAHSDPLVVHRATKRKAAKVSPTYIPRHLKGGASYQWHLTDKVWARYPAWVLRFAKCVSHHESWSPHMWTAENPLPYSADKGASGGFQWQDPSWRTNLAHSGLSGPPRAADASPVLQAEVTAWVITHHGQWNWSGSHCGYGT